MARACDMEQQTTRRLEPGTWNLEPARPRQRLVSSQRSAVSQAGQATRPDWSQASSHGCLEAGSKNTARLSACSVAVLQCGYSVRICILCRVAACSGCLISRAGLHQESKASRSPYSREQQRQPYNVLASPSCCHYSLQLCVSLPSSKSRIALHPRHRKPMPSPPITLSGP